MRDVVILGSTGSIRTQAVDVVSQRPERFRVLGFAALACDVVLNGITGAAGL